MRFLRRPVSALAALAAMVALARAVPQGDDIAGAVVTAGPKPADVFHPDRETPATPRYGGRVIVHISALPKHICYPLENSSETRRMLYQVHESLLLQDWEFHDHRPNAAEECAIEDLVVLKESAHGKYAGETDARVVRRDGPKGLRGVRAVYGKVAAQEDGDLLVTPASPSSDLEAPVEVAAADVDVIERGTVFTFTLRPARWHPSLVYAKDEAAVKRIGEQVLDARDVQFSWSIYKNPGVDCGERRSAFEKITDCRVLDERRVRFFYQEQYAFAVQQIGTVMCLLPSHLYDLSDPANPAYDPDATATKQAEHINLNPHNQLWVGLGPYRITEWSQQYIQAERFTDAKGKALYFDRANAGYFDTIRWRYIADDEAGMTALLNGELDYFERIKTADFVGPRTRTPEFERSFYKGTRYLGDYGYTGWNMHRPQLADKAVRIALAHAFDLGGYLRSQYSGLARQTTGPVPYGTDGYPADLEPFPYDPERAREILEEAGWYDRDGDDVVDKDGVKLALEFLYPQGNEASKIFGQKLQESFKAIGVEVSLLPLEWATCLERVKNREFDAINLSWIPPLESDPEQLWHSRLGAQGVRSSNNAGVQDPRVDALILAIQRELDVPKRMALWREFHRYLYQEVQPYLFLFNVPKKFAVQKRIRGMQSFAIDPGYSVRRWYLSDPTDPALRDTLDR